MAKAIELYDQIPESFILHQFSNSANPESTAAPRPRKSGATRVALLISSSPAWARAERSLASRKSSRSAGPSESHRGRNGGVAHPFGSKPGPHKLRATLRIHPRQSQPDIVDEIITVKEEDSGLVSKEINRLDGIPAGISGGAIVWAALQIAKRPENEGKTIVAIIPSASERCLSSRLFADIDVSGDPIESGLSEPEHTPGQELILT